MVEMGLWKVITGEVGQDSELPGARLGGPVAMINDDKTMGLPGFEVPSVAMS
jgi:hypothetical protein